MNDKGNDCLTSVDGTDFQITDQGDHWDGWYSFKFKKPGLQYEVALCILTGGWIVWIQGPYPLGIGLTSTFFDML